MPVQRWRSQIDDLRTIARHRYDEVFTEPVGGHGVWNGAFTQGPDGQWPAIEGWEVHANALQTISRVSTNPLTGSHHVRGLVDAVGGTAPGYMESQRFLPASVLHDYLLYISFYGSAGGINVRSGVRCYNAAKVSLGAVYSYGPAAPGAAWVEQANTHGPGGSAFPAGTRWVRILIDWTTTTANSYVDVDAVIWRP